MFPTLLIIDDEPSILQSLGGLLEDEGFEVLTATNGYEGLKIIEASSPDLVLLDIWMPGLDGLEILGEIKKQAPFIPVIVITGHGNVETAVKATKLGAFNLIEKPLSIDKVLVDIQNALHFRRLEEENRFLRKKAIEKHAITGSSPAILQVKQQIATVAGSDSWVLITGENGTGKEMAARSLHHFSRRAEGPFVDINCASIPEQRLESELFGHERGGVDWDAGRRRGRLELADQGTLFLDEICDMAPGTQAALMRVLQERTFQRVGGGRLIRADVRVIAATNRDIRAEIAASRFREDLYFRLNEVPIHLPPLRDRRQDIPELARLFLAETARKEGLKEKRLDDEVLAMLQEYHWPGNVRELKNLLARLALMTDADAVTTADLPAPYNPEVGDRLRSEAELFSHETLAVATECFREAFIRRRLLENGHDVEVTARRIGVEPEEVRRIVGTVKNEDDTRLGKGRDQ